MMESRWGGAFCRATINRAWICHGLGLLAGLLGLLLWAEGALAGVETDRKTCPAKTCAVHGNPASGVVQRAVGADGEAETHISSNEHIGDEYADIDAGYIDDDPYGLLDIQDEELGADAGADGYVVFDPLELLNRYLFAFGRMMDLVVIRPFTAMIYEPLPTPVVERLIDLTSVIDMPASSVQLLLQGQPRLAANQIGRFVGSLVCCAGLVDIERGRGYFFEDFGQTLAVYGVSRGPFVATLYGLPTNFRDSAVFGLQNTLGSEFWYVHHDPLRYLSFLTGWGALYSSVSLSLLALERGYSGGSIQFVETGLDPYDTYRHAISQRRDFLVDYQYGEFISQRKADAKSRQQQEQAKDSP